MYCALGRLRWWWPAAMTRARSMRSDAVSQIRSRDLPASRSSCILKQVHQDFLLFGALGQFAWPRKTPRIVSDKIVESGHDCCRPPKTKIVVSSRMEALTGLR
jgi:hypothetical protein